MGSLLKWEMKQTFQSKVLWSLLVVMTVCLCLIVLLFDKEQSSAEDCAAICSNLNSLMVLFIGAFAGVHVTAAFEGRRIQAAVMAGNSRFHVISAKLFSYSVSVALMSFVALSCATAVSFAIRGINGLEDNFFNVVIGRIIVYTIVLVSFTGICFLLAYFIKNLGLSIVSNLILMLVLNSVGPMLMTTEETTAIAKFTAWGQTSILLMDVSTQNLMCATIGSFIGTALVLMVAFLKFKNEELK